MNEILERGEGKYVSSVVINHILKENHKDSDQNYTVYRFGGKMSEMCHQKHKLTSRNRVESHTLFKRVLNEIIKTLFTSNGAV